MGVDVDGRAGGLAIFWKDSVDFRISSNSLHHILGEVFENGVRSWSFCGIYGWAAHNDKSKTWNLIKEVFSNNSLPIIFGGDFNEILDHNEKQGGQRGHRKGMEDFRKTVLDCQLLDLGTKGEFLTWERGRSKETRIRKRLDRYLCTGDWYSKFDKVEVVSLTRMASDHNPILLNIEGIFGHQKGTYKLRLEPMWIKDKRSLDQISRVWNSSGEVDTMDRINRSVWHLKHWGEDTFNNIRNQIKTTEKELKEAQNKTSQHWRVDDCILLERKLEDLLNQNDTYWRTRAKVFQIKDGDRNTKFFHQRASIQKKQNKIDKLIDEAGNYRTTQGDLENLITSFYAQLFTSDGLSLIHI